MTKARLPIPARAISMTELINLKCTKIIEQTHDVKTFVFSIPAAQSMGYLAGQHTNFSLNIKGKQQHCCYTLSSSPTNTERVSLTIKRVENGIVSNYFHDHFIVGNVIQAQTANGNFHLPEKIPKKVLLLSAGSGITPMISMLRYMSVMQSNNEIVFFHSAHTEQDLIARTAIDNLALQHGNCQVIYTLSQQIKPQWQGYQGRLNQRMLANISQLEQFDVYVCGPKGFRQNAQQLLKQQGVKREHYHYESFGERPIEQVIVNQPITVKNKPENANKIKPDLYFSKWQRHYQGNNHETLLAQGEAAGLILPYSCRSGSCGSCKAKLITGQVKQLATDGLSEDEKQQGYILLCSCLPISDITIEHDQRR